MNSKIVLGIVVGLIVVLVLGVFIGVLFISPSKTSAGKNNQVQVSGTIQEQNPNEIYFVSFSKIISTSDIITNGQYSVVLVGNQSYDVVVAYPCVYEPSENNYNSYTIFVPSDVTTFTANF